MLHKCSICYNTVTGIIRSAQCSVVFTNIIPRVFNLPLSDPRPLLLQFEREACVGKVSRSIPLGGEILTLSALDFDAGNMISYRVVSGNADTCFYLDETSGVLTAKCDLGRLMMNKRVLNVTATDGQHFADVMPIEINLVETDGFRRDTSLNGRNAMFECRTTNVAQRLEDILSHAERNNAKVNDEEVFSRSSSRYLANIHYPVFQRLPKSFYVNETSPIGSIVFQVSSISSLFFGVARFQSDCICYIK